MKLIYNKKIEKLFSEFIEEAPIKTFLNELMTKDFNEYINALTICFLAIDIAISKKFNKKNTKIIGYAGIFHNLSNYNIAPEKIVRKTISNKNKNLTENESQLKSNNEKLTIDCFNNSPKQFFSSISEFDTEKIIKVILISQEIYNDTKYNRTEEQRRINSRFLPIDRRNKEESLEQLAQIIAIAKTYNESKTKITKNYYLEHEEDIILQLKNKFILNDEDNSKSKFNHYIDEIIART